MPTRIPGVRFADAYALPQSFGWRFNRQVGSHIRMVNDAGTYITIPRHDRRDLDSKTLGGIVEQAGINPDHFLWGLGRADRRGPPRPAPLATRPARLNSNIERITNPSVLHSPRCR